MINFMNNSQLDRVLRLVRRTGDHCLIFDRETDTPAVVVSLDEYERGLDRDGRLSEMSESEMLNKINRDIATWKEIHGHDDFEDELNEGEEFTNENYSPSEKFNSEEELSEPTNSPTVEFDLETPVAMPVEPKFETVENVADFSEKTVHEEILSEVESDEEEEKFYLEPVS